MPLTLSRRCPQGLIDMDTGDPAGDIGFGLWELLMPMQCRPTPGGGMHHHGGNNIGCQNGTGRYIHPGAASNVYEQFIVQANPLLGDYHNCNPNPADGSEGPPGVFNCDSMD